MIGKWTQLWAKKNEIDVHYFTSVRSTNTYAKEMVPDWTDFQLLVTEHQTGGRGRNNNKWEDSGEGRYLLSSWCYKTRKTPQPIFAPLVGLAVFNSLQENWPHLNFSMKAPNDLYLDENKVGGILIESISIGQNTYTSIGIGINVNEKPGVSFTTYIAEKLTREVDQGTWNQFLGRLMVSLRTSLEKGFESQLSEKDCEILLGALNKNPNLENPWISVSTNGTLISDRLQTEWSDI